MKKIVFAALIIGAVLLQSTLISRISFFGARPDLTWIMVMACGLFLDLRSAVFFCALCGLLKDSLGVSSFGASTILFPMWCIAIASASKRISFDATAVSSLFLFFMMLVNAVVLRILPYTSAGNLPIGSFLRVSFIESASTALLFIWLGPVLRRVSLTTLW
ncbi:MAG: rod shape-determining protein MreD [Candidatus Omnitrophica bacterium]|jgi:rod shape-determining protein MreD|nr:rod shape-determining protein MreD [Candidatus Omnitrophota bacterium]